MVRRRGTISVAIHKTAMERGDEPCRTRFYRSTRTCSRRSWTVSCPEGRGAVERDAGRFRPTRSPGPRDTSVRPVGGPTVRATTSGNLTVKAGTMTLRVPKLKGAVFESAVVERYRRREQSVEEAPVGMYLAGVGTRQVDDVSRLLWGERMPLPDALRQAQARVRGHRSIGGTVPWRPIRTRTCSVDGVRRQAHVGRVGRERERAGRHRRGRHRPP